MQTFLPYPDFKRSAECLDVKRLGQQRREVLALLSGGWRNHPASKMWQGYEQSLVQYGFAICSEWISRGYSDRCMAWIAEYFNKGIELTAPPWLDGPIHASHRANLLRKDPKHYSQFGWAEEPSDVYFWPSLNTEIRHSNAETRPTA